MILSSIVCVILSELAFLLGYLLTYGVYLLIDLALAALLRRRLSRITHASIAGILCGLAGVFCALSVAYAFSRLGKVTGPWLLLISIVLPAMGLFAYFEKLFREVATGVFHKIPLYGRLHGAMMTSPKSAQFAHAKLFLEQAQPDRVGLEGDPLGHSAYQLVQKYLLRMTIFSIGGAIIGLFLAYRVFGR
jgi:hypothetical protein